MMEMLAVVVGSMVVAGIAAAFIINKLIYICPPNEVLIFSGGQRAVAGRQVGYRLIQGGRGIRIPMMERVDRLDLTNMIIDIEVRGAYSKGGIPLNVEGVANVKISSTEPTIGNAIVRFLGTHREHVIRVARETLEGNLRGVLATLTPEEVNQDRVKFAGNLLHEADVDLTRLGLELDTLKIQNVSDDVGYLDSIGRKTGADLLMRSRIAEAQNKAQIAERNAENWQTQEIAKVEADIAEARAEAQRRIVDARTKKDAMVEEQRAIVTANIAKAEGELEVQRARIDQVRLQLLADTIKPAEADLSRAIEAAKGASSKLVEDGKATASAIRDISRTWKQAGDAAREIFVAQKLSVLVGHMMSTVKPAPVDKITFIDKRLTSGSDNLAVKAAVISEQLKHTVGLDLPALLQKLVGEKNGAVERVLPADIIEDPSRK